MSSRREEKEQRRAERIAAEEAEAQAAARRRRLGIAAGVVLGLAAVGAVVFALSGRMGGDDTTATTSTSAPRVPIPAQRTTDLRAAARAAGCQLRTFTPGANDREHVTTPVRYRQNPPVFGPHSPAAASDGNYVGQGTPPVEALVHSLEHGRVVIWYRPDVGERRVGQLQTLFLEPFNDQPNGYKQLLVERQGLPVAVAATSWGQQMTCPRFGEPTFDALRAFRATYVDKGPEDIPFPQ